MSHPDEGREVIVGVLRATHLDPPEYEYGFMCHECEEALWYDPLLCEALARLGYDKGVEVFKRLDKWYS